MTARAISFTFSIASGTGLGFVAFAAIKPLTGRWREVGRGMATIALAFTVKEEFGA